MPVFDQVSDQITLAGARLMVEGAFRQVRQQWDNRVFRCPVEVSIHAGE
jgi:hypothetical protein